MTSLPHEKQRKEVKEMNTLVIVLIAAVCLFGAYTLYGRWLANKWGIDPTAKTPAVVHEDGRDYVPTNGWTVFAHQFSSIAGAGPVTGAIQAAAFGWLPVLLWVLLGGIFFGAVTDFGALYASVKNDGKSMGMLIEKYIGKTGRKLFLLFCWLFCGIVIAAFADMVAGTFNAYTGADGALVRRCSDQRRCRHGLHHVHGLRCGLWPDPEEVQLLRLEGEPCISIVCIVAVLCHWRKSAHHPGQGRMELYHLRLYLLCRRASHVAAEAAPGLHDHLHVRLP